MARIYIVKYFYIYSKTFFVPPLGLPGLGSEALERARAFVALAAEHLLRQKRKKKKKKAGFGLYRVSSLV